MKNVPTDADAGWRIWNWSKRFDGLIGEDQTGNLRIELFRKKFFTDIILSFPGDIPPMMEEDNMDIRETTANIKAGKLRTLIHMTKYVCSFELIE